MKSIVKTALTFSLLLPLAGCWDFGWSKRNQDYKSSETTTYTSHEYKPASKKCSHPGCNHDHSKDVQKKHHHDKMKSKDMNVETQGMDNMDDMDMDMNSMNMDVEAQNMDDMSDMDMDYNY